MAKEDKFADEVLSEDELEQVAGGDCIDTAKDSKLLSLYGLCPCFSSADIELTSGTAKEEQVKAAWAKVGVDFEYRGYFLSNKYYMNGNEISQEAAHQHVIDTLGDPISYVLEHHIIMGA